MRWGYIFKKLRWVPNLGVSPCAAWLLREEHMLLSEVEIRNVGPRKWDHCSECQDWHPTVLVRRPVHLLNLTFRLWGTKIVFNRSHSLCARPDRALWTYHSSCWQWVSARWTCTMQPCLVWKVWAQAAGWALTGENLIFIHDLIKRDKTFQPVLNIHENKYIDKAIVPFISPVLLNKTAISNILDSEI